MFYIGAHSCDSLENEYMGSGIRIRRAIKKYGIENFSKEILTICENEESLYKEEAVIIEKYLEDKSCYNLNAGGKGSWSYVNKNGLSTNWHMKTENEIKTRIINKMKETKSKNKEKYDKISIENLKKATLANKGSKKSDQVKLNQSNAYKKFWKNTTEEYRIKRRLNVSLRYQITDTDGNVYIVDALQEFCKKMNLPYTTLCMAKGRQIKAGKCKGWHSIRIEK